MSAGFDHKVGRTNVIKVIDLEIMILWRRYHILMSFEDMIKILILDMKTQLLVKQINPI